ncbi:UNVERIFIED_CONTAM: hypothetical protein FKN15_037656 [Acipenser sinensis]
MQEATRKQSECTQQWRQEWGLPTWEQEFPVSQLELVLQKLVWPAPQQESLVPQPEPELQALETELPAPERKPAVPELQQELQLSEEEELPPPEPEGEELPELQQELQLSEEEELPPPELEGEELPELQQELQLYEEEEVKCPAPPQPRPPPQQSSPALVGTVPCPVLVDTLPECMDLPVLDLVPRSGHHQAQLLTWSLAPLPLKPQTSRHGRVTSLAFPLPPAVFPLESQRSLRRSRGSHLCLSLHRPGYRPTRRSPLASRLGPSSLDHGPYLEAPEESTHPQAHPKDREKMGLCGLKDFPDLRKNPALYQITLGKDEPGTIQTFVIPHSHMDVGWVYTVQEEVKVKIKDLNEHIVCYLCAGYYIDATTITECLHTFCKSCIVKYLQTSKYCPMCNIKIHETQPLLNLKLDRVMQDIVYKLVPGLQENEEKRIREFYQSRGLDRVIQPTNEDAVPDPAGLPYTSFDHSKAHYYRYDEQISLCLERQSSLSPKLACT